MRSKWVRKSRLIICLVLALQRDSCSERGKSLQFCRINFSDRRVPRALCVVQKKFARVINIFADISVPGALTVFLPLFASTKLRSRVQLQIRSFLFPCDTIVGIALKSRLLSPVLSFRKGELENPLYIFPSRDNRLVPKIALFSQLVTPDRLQ